MWFVTTYQPVSLTSLKMSMATSTGGKSLLLPTPFAIKMALLDAAIRSAGVTRADHIWPLIRDLPIAIRGPERIAVNNTFTKILKPDRNKAPDPDTGLLPPMLRTIAFREYVQWQGSVQIAIATEEGDETPWPQWLTQIHYMGKRGGFVQATAAPDRIAELDDSFALLTEESDAFTLDGTLQLMDDCGPKMTFAHADIYSGKNISLNKPNGRILRPVVLPYRVERSSRGYTLYRRIE